MSFTNGFPDQETLELKFDKHVTQGREFSYVDANEYGRQADRFLGGPMDADTEECVRKKRNGGIGDTVRYNRLTQEFGVLGNDGTIRSYYVPRPGPSGHGFVNNYLYWRNSCSQVRG